MRRRRCTGALALLGALLLLAGCEQTLDPETLDATGRWTVNLGAAPSEFEFRLEEGPGGSVTGTWSLPTHFSNYPVWGRREGEVLKLAGYSYNSHPSSLEVRFVRRNQMEGSLYFATLVYDVTLHRR